MAFSLPDMPYAHDALSALGMSREHAKKKTSVLVAIAVLASLASGAAVADVKRYDCTFDDRYESTPPRVQIDVDRATGRVVVADDISREFAGGPVAGKIAKDTPERTTIRWSVHMSNSRGQRARMDYALNLFHGGRSPTLRAKPFGYDNDFGGAGSCKVTSP